MPEGQGERLVDRESYDLATRAGELLKARGLTLAAAESCTGGLLMNYVTDVPGSSAYLEGGVVAYSYEAKERVLGVGHKTLYDHGAVSEPTAREMARGVRRQLVADIGIAITGIAGPGGAMSGKPVGLVFIALSAPDGEWCERHVWSGDRWSNKRQSALAALRLLIRYLEQGGN